MNYSKPTNECPVCGGEFVQVIPSPSGAFSTIGEGTAQDHIYFHLLEEMADENKEEE